MIVEPNCAQHRVSSPVGVLTTACPVTGPPNPVQHESAGRVAVAAAGSDSGATLGDSVLTMGRAQPVAFPAVRASRAGCRPVLRVVDAVPPRCTACVADAPW